jgi:hypothetical protein
MEESKESASASEATPEPAKEPAAEAVKEPVKEPVKAPAPEPAREYEFTEAENKVLRELVETLSVAGLVMLALGIASVLYAGVYVTGPLHDPTPLVVVATCAPLVIAGWWLRGAAAPLQRVVETRGKDISHLMDALREFQRIFALQRTGFALAFLVAVVGLLLRAFT